MLTTKSSTTKTTAEVPAVTDRQENQERQSPAGAGREDVHRADGASENAANGDRLAAVSEDIHHQVLRERDEYLESLQRLQADFDNFRKRVARDSQTSSSRVAAEIVEELLPVLDNFERAMHSAMQHDEEILGEGVELVYRQLRDVLDRRGLCEIKARGENFDPEHHEAVLCQPSTEHEEGKVVDVLEKGYRVHDKVVRPARVIVSEGHPGSAKRKD